MNIQEIEISKIKPYSLNAKKHPQTQVEGIAESIRRFGFTQPLVVDSNNEIIIGHGRHAAALLVGLKTVPCLRLENLSEKEIKALRLIDNRISETGWDVELLAEEFKDLNFDFTAFNIDFDSLLKSFNVDPTDAPGLDSGEKSAFRQVTFTVHEEQYESIEEALEHAKSKGGGESDFNENSNGNALTYICLKYLNGRS